MVSPIVNPALKDLNNLPGFPPVYSNTTGASFTLGTYLNLLAAAVNSTALTGNILWVDSVNGDDSDAVAGDLSHPYLTVAAAIAAATSGQIVFLLPGTYNLTADLVVPDGVTLRGFCHHVTTIQRLLVTTDAVLVTLGADSALETVALRLTSAEHHTLTGVLFAATATEETVTYNIEVEVDNSTAGDAGTSNVYGIHVLASVTPIVGAHPAIDDTVVNVFSAGLGTKRGILLDTNVSYMRSQDGYFACLRTGAGAGSYIGAEVNKAAAVLSLSSGSCNGTSADMSQTLGTLEVLGTQLTNDNANSLGFTVLAASPRFVWGTNGAVASGTRYLYPGTATETTNEIKIRLAGKGIAKSIQVRARVGPGGARTDTYTLRKNGVDTALTVSLTDGDVSALNASVSVAFSAQDDLSMKVVTAAGSTTVDVTIVVELY